MKRHFAFSVCISNYCAYVYEGCAKVPVPLCDSTVPSLLGILVALLLEPRLRHGCAGALAGGPTKALFPWKVRFELKQSSMNYYLHS
jgi:hypothetical protein